MGTMQSVQNEIQTLREHIVSETAQVVAALKALADEIVLLKEQISNGGNVTSGQFDDLVAQVRQITVDVDGITSPR
jgi:flagellin-like hook-associated protein FlgL